MFTQHEKRNEAPELYEVGVESPAIGIAAEDEGGCGNNGNGQERDE